MPTLVPSKLEYFTIIKNPERAATLFKESIGRVGFAISSYCNRQCSYCPNSIADRKSTRNYMSDDLFFSILRQLSKIDYSEQVNVTRYNEPLADKEYALSRLRDIRVFLPKATIQIYTNGDYLDRSYLDDLARIGVDRIVATVHAGPGGKTDIESLIIEQDRRIAELDLPFTFGPETIKDKVRIATTKHGHRTTLDYVAHDFMRGAETGNAWAFDRGGSLDIPKTFVRTDPCFVQFNEIDIEWDGTLLPCCQIHNDVFENDEFVLAKLGADTNLFVTWTSASYVSWRIKMYNFDRKARPCATCTYGIAEGNRAQHKAGIEQVQKVLFSVQPKVSA